MSRDVKSSPFHSVDDRLRAFAVNISEGSSQKRRETNSENGANIAAVGIVNVCDCVSENYQQHNKREHFVIIIVIVIIIMMIMIIIMMIIIIIIIT